MHRTLGKKNIEMKFKFHSKKKPFEKIFVIYLCSEIDTTLPRYISHAVAICSKSTDEFIYDLCQYTKVARSS